MRNGVEGKINASLDFSPACGLDLPFRNRHSGLGLWQEKCKANRQQGWILACTEMTINNKIRTPQVVLIVGLSWASNDITFGLKKLHLAVRALP